MIVAFALTCKELGKLTDAFKGASRDPTKPIEEIKKIMEELRGRVDGLISSVQNVSSNTKELEKKLFDKIEKGLNKDKRLGDTSPGSHAPVNRGALNSNPNSLPPSRGSEPELEARLQRDRDAFDKQRKEFNDSLATREAELNSSMKSLDERQQTVDRREADVKSREQLAIEQETILLRREQECSLIEAQAQAKHDEARAARETATAERTKIAEIENRLRQWREEFWPKSLQGDGPLSHCRTQLESLSAEGKTIATLTSLALAKCRVLIGAREDKDNELPKALHELSRYLYLLWSETEADPGRQAEQARKFKNALDAELLGRYTIRLVEVGVPKDQSWMTYSDGNTPVQKVHSWCVQNEKKVTVQRANVS
jgi:chromosome segregation ATPase